MKKYEFIDAQEMGRKHPNTFDAPSLEILRLILPYRPFVKVCIAGERFWVRVTRINGNRVNGIVWNERLLTDLHGYSYGDSIRFELRHIYEFMAEKGFFHRLPVRVQRRVFEAAQKLDQK